MRKEIGGFSLVGAYDLTSVRHLPSVPALSDAHPQSDLGSKNIDWQPRFDGEYYTVMYISMTDNWETRMCGQENGFPELSKGTLSVNVG